ncbi:hypothetical protein IT570_00290 [Candidatus Sumerlaeota bacterium]|nr:hypothetical protein [Candidatus Sumerlaeota bacterium]
MKLSAFRFGNSPAFEHFQRKRASLWRERALGTALKVYCFELALLAGLLCAFVLMVLQFGVVLIVPPALYVYANLGELRKKLNVRKFWALDVYNPSIYTELAVKMSSEEIFAAAWKETLRKFYLLCFVILAVIAITVLHPWMVGGTYLNRHLWVWRTSALLKECQADQAKAMMTGGMLLLLVLALLRSCYLSWKSLFLFEAIPENVYGSRPRIFIYSSIIVFLTLFIASASEDAGVNVVYLLSIPNLGLLLGGLVAHQIFQYFLIRRRTQKLQEECPDLNLA